MVLSGWLYRKSHVITSGSTLTDYQVRIRIYRSTGSDSGYNVYVGSKCLSNYNDIRFTTSDGDTLIPYWIEYNDSSYADIWVKLPSISTTTIYIYYGNDSATAYSNGDNTFIFFDNFAGTTINSTKWSSTANTLTYTVNNKLIITDATKSGDTYWIYNNTDIGSQIISNAIITTNCEIICKQILYDSAASQMGQAGIAFTTPNTVQAYTCHSDGNGAGISPSISYIIGSTTGYTTVTAPDTRLLSLKKIGTSYTSSHKINISDNWSVLGTVTNSNSVTKFAIAAGAYGGYPYFEKVEIYYIFIKNAAATEPIHSTWGSEEYFGDYAFNYDPESGNFPLTVSFAFSKYTSGFIDFGDGTTTNSLSTFHIYTKPGSYDLLAIGDVIDYYDLPNAITVTTPTVTSLYTYVASNNIVTFTDTSTGEVCEWLWNFGDENISFEQNPVHEFFAPGNYNVTLLASNNYLNDLHTATITISNSSVFWPQTASFTYDQAKEDKICRMEFYGVSEPSIYTPNTSYLWNFGDGHTSTLQNPIHYYNNSGTYTVTFTVYNVYGNKSDTQSITVEEPVIINFTPSFAHGIAPAEITFTDTTYPQEEIIYKLWDFGDSFTSEDANPSHTYANEGIYSPSLSITYWGGTRTLTKINSVIINTKALTLKETITFGDPTVEDMAVKILEDTLSFPTEVCAPGILLEEKIPFIQMEVPTISGSDEFGYSYTRLFTHFGHRIFDTLTSFGRKIVKEEAVDDRTGLSIANARVFKDTIYFETELNAEPAT